MILVDTSVWIDHFRKANSILATLLAENEVAIHPFIIGELACGMPKKARSEVLLLQYLPGVEIASHQETLDMLEEHQLYSKGIGWVDAHLLASSLISRAQLWTLDRGLLSCASSLHIRFLT